jgi:hypothetical protein
MRGVQAVDGNQKGIEGIDVDDGGTGQRLLAFAQIQGTAVGFSLIPFRVYYREAVGPADERAGGIQQAAVVLKQRAAFPFGLFRNMPEDLFSMEGWKRVEGGPQGCRLNRKKCNRRTAAAATGTAGDLPGEHLPDAETEGIYAGHHLVIIV